MINAFHYMTTQWPETSMLYHESVHPLCSQLMLLSVVQAQPHRMGSANRSCRVEGGVVLGCDCINAEGERKTSAREHVLSNWNVHYRYRDSCGLAVSPEAILCCDETMTQEQPNLETRQVSEETSPFGLEWQVWPSSLCSSPPANWIRLLPRIILSECMYVCGCERGREKLPSLSGVFAGSLLSQV